MAKLTSSSILSGCPTNAQLTLHLLRVSEDLKTPLPPPPENKDIKSAKKTLKDTSPANPSGAAVAAEKREIEESNNPAEKTKAKTKHHLSNAFKKISKKLAGVHGDVAVDGNTKPVRSLSAMAADTRSTTSSRINSSTRSSARSRRTPMAASLTARVATSSSTRTRAVSAGCACATRPPKVYGTLRALSSFAR